MGGIIITGWNELRLPAMSQELIDDMSSLRVHLSKMCADVISEDLS